MSVRKILLKIHLYLGLAAAVFLVILGLTGSVIAFEGDLEHWLHPNLWYVAAGDRPMAESDLIAAVERQVAPAHVGAVQISKQRNLVQVMQLTDRSAALVDPYKGTIVGRISGPTATQKVLGYIHQIHLRLTSDPRSGFGPIGKAIVSYAGLVLCFLVPTGLILWWRAKRASVRWDASFFRLCYDTHNVMGIYAGMFLFTAAFTGVLIGFEFGESLIFSLTHSSRPVRGRPLASTPTPGATPIDVDQALAAARAAMPDAFVEIILLPRTATASFVFVLRVPEETSGSPHSDITVDRYSGRVLQVHNFLTESQGYRWIRFNRSIHTGDIWGLPGHILASLSSLLLAGMVLTGLVIWWKKLAV